MGYACKGQSIYYNLFGQTDIEGCNYHCRRDGRRYATIRRGTTIPMLKGRHLSLSFPVPHRILPSMKNLAGSFLRRHGTKMCLYHHGRRTPFSNTLCRPHHRHCKHNDKHFPEVQVRAKGSQPQEKQKEEEHDIGRGKKNGRRQMEPSPTPSSATSTAFSWHSNGRDVDDNYRDAFAGPHVHTPGAQRHHYDDDNRPVVGTMKRAVQVTAMAMGKVLIRHSLFSFCAPFSSRRLLLSGRSQRR